jgi:hypothetical protein
MPQTLLKLISDKFKVINIFWMLLAAFLLYTCTKKESPQKAYNSYTYPAPISKPNLQFGRYDCTVDCSGHQAGYEWAERYSIDDENDCSGNSQSFIEGCKQYVDENN